MYVKTSDKECDRCFPLLVRATFHMADNQVIVEVNNAYVFTEKQRLPEEHFNAVYEKLPTDGDTVQVLFNSTDNTPKLVKVPFEHEFTADGGLPEGPDAPESNVRSFVHNMHPLLSIIIHAKLKDPSHVPTWGLCKRGTQISFRKDNDINVYLLALYEETPSSNGYISAMPETTSQGDIYFINIQC